MELYFSLILKINKIISTAFHFYHPCSLQDSPLHAIRCADLLPYLVRSSVWREERVLVPDVLLPLPVNADGECLTMRRPALIWTVHRRP